MKILVAGGAGYIAVSYTDVSRAWQELGWKAERGIDQMCENSCRWQKNYPKGYQS